MTLLNFEGFETIGTDADSGSSVQGRLAKRYDIVAGSNPVILNDDFANEGFGLRLPANSFGAEGGFYVTLPASLQVTNNASVPTFIFGARYFVPSTTVNEELIEFLDATNARCYLRFESGGNLLAYGNVSQVGSTATGVLTPGAWNYVEWEFKPTTSGNGGFMKVRVNGSEVINSTGTVYNTADRTIRRFFFKNAFIINGTGTNWLGIDDLYLIVVDGTSPNTYLGPVRVVRAAPSADTAQKDWTPDSGSSNFDRVNENGASSSTYVESDTDGDVDNYELSNPTILGTIFAVKTEVEYINPTSGTPKLHFGLREGSTDSEEEVTVDNTADTEVAIKIDVEKPSGGAWTGSALNDTETILRFES